MTAIGLNVTKSLLSVSMINYPSKQACGCEVMVNDLSIAMVLQVREFQHG